MGNTAQTAESNEKSGFDYGNLKPMNLGMKQTPDSEARLSTSNT